MSGPSHAQRPQLRLVRGGAGGKVVGGVQVVEAPRHCSPFAVEAVVEEEDTFLVLSAEPALRQPVDHPVRLMTALWNLEPKPIGSIWVRQGYPLRLLAVVYDLDEEPASNEEWIRSALNEIFATVHQRQLRAVALPFLGVRLRALDRSRFRELLEQELGREPAPALKRLWLVEPQTHEPPS